MPEIRTGLAAAAGWPSMLLRVSCRNHRKETKDQKTDHPKPPFKPPTPSGLISNQGAPEPALENRLSVLKVLMTDNLIQIHFVSYKP